MEIGDESLLFIVEVIKKSGNLKGTMVKALKEASHGMIEVVQVLASRSEPKEMSRIRADNSRLHREVAALKAEIQAQRKEFAEMRASAAKAAVSSEMPSLNVDILEELRRSVISSVGVMLDARFSGIEERLLPEKTLRPSLAAERRREATRPSVSSYRRSGLPILQERSPPEIDYYVQRRSTPLVIDFFT